MADEKVVTVRYEVDALKAGETVKHLSHQVEHSASAFSKGTHAVRHWAKEALLMGTASAGVQLGFHGLMEMVKESNQSLIEAREHLTGIYYSTLQWGKGVSEVDKINRSFEYANEQIEEMEHTVMKFGVPLKTVEQAYSQLALTAGGYTKSHEQMNKLTEDTVAISKVFRTDASMAAMQVGRMIQTGVLPRMGELGAFFRQNIEHAKNFAKLTPEKRMEELQKALAKAAPIASKLSEGWATSWFRIRESIEKAVRTLTTPIFKEISEDIEKAAKWMLHLSEDGQGMGEKLGEWYKDLRDGVSLIADQWDRVKKAIELGLIPMKLMWDYNKKVFDLIRGVVGGGPGGSEILRRDVESRTQGFRSLRGQVSVFEHLRKEVEGRGHGGMGPRPGEEKEYTGYTNAMNRQKEQILESAKLIPNVNKELAVFADLLHETIESSSGLQKTDAEFKLQDVHILQGLLKGEKEKSTKPPFQKPVQNFGDIHIVQDFKDVDPDRVFVRFKEDLERLPEKMTQARSSIYDNGM